MDRKIENPYWSNKENKHLIVEFVYGDGQRQLASIVGEDNPDYQSVIEEFGEEKIDENTKLRLERREEQIRRNRDRQTVDRARMQQEALFAAKLDAFEIPIIKTSKNKTLKSKIRKAKSLMEVTAYAVMLITYEENLTAMVSEATENVE